MKNAIFATIIATLIPACAADVSPDITAEGQEGQALSPVLRGATAAQYRTSRAPSLAVVPVGPSILRPGETAGINAVRGLASASAWCVRGEIAQGFGCDVATFLDDGSPGLVETSRSLGVDQDGRARSVCSWRSVAPDVSSGQGYTSPQIGRAWILCATPL